MLYAACNAKSIGSPISNFFIKPSHYDDEGYVIQWFRPTMPSNSLAVVDALVRSAAERRILGPDVDIEVSAIDETNRRVPLKSIVARLARNKNFGFVRLVGIQSNEFPRALDIARPLRPAGINVVIGGFHVSGCLAMLPEMPADMAAGIADGTTLFAGECETHLDDHWRLYNQTLAADSALDRERRVAGRSAMLSLSRLDDGTEGVPTLQAGS